MLTPTTPSTSSPHDTPTGSRSTTPQPPLPPRRQASSSDQTQTVAAGGAGDAAGLLSIRVIGGRNLCLPPNETIPPAIEAAVKAGHARKAAAQANQRNGLAPSGMKKCWWIPYIVLEYDKNSILVDSVGGQLSQPIWGAQADFDVSRASDISISAYLRKEEPVEQGPDEKQKVVGDDILIARANITPPMDAGPDGTDQWYKATIGTAEFHLLMKFKSKSDKLRMESFELLALIGKGSFGKVMQVRKKDTGRIYALKSIRKASVLSKPGEITHILAERTVLALVDNPFIVPLKFSFQTPDKLYLVMPFINGGELFYHLQREGRFDLNRARFYTAELLCALEHLHSFGVVYRDLKPENILLDYTGHIALCDFGLCKVNMGDDDKTNTFCGTPEYIAPELLENKGYSKTVDWWTLGVLLFEMLTGLPPFYDQDINKMYQKILHDPLKFPEGMPSEAQKLVTALLVRNPNERLGHGSHGAEDIRKESFFAKIDWKKLMAKKIAPPFKPSVRGLIDVSNFDPEFTNEKAMDSLVVESKLSKTVQDQFKGFTYNPTNEHLAQKQYGSVIR